ncbi:MAG TPA: peptidoglycan-binding protein [Caulobacteraceae bacterium]|jgi:localization factor PodJL|nr:peptidoglycan-binding protein [Caulobacteraceae bacterium]
MTASAPWSVKGIDPKAREIAKDLARRSGMTLGEWLNQMILEDGTPEAAAPARPAALSTAEPAPSYARFEAPEHPGDDVLRASQALDRLSARIEAAEQRATLAISGIDQSVAGVLNRLETAEREQTAVAARFEGAVGNLTEENARLSDRLQRMELEAVAPPSVEAVRSMEAALAKVASHLYDGEARADQRFGELRRELDGLGAQLAAAPASGGAGEAEGVLERLSGRLSEAEERTSAAMRGLEASFAQLDQRLAGAESHLQTRPAEASLEQLAADLSARVDAARAEMADKIREAADGRFERMERTLGEMTVHVEEAERRSTSAIERMGHEVLRMADTLGRRVQEVEHRSADAIEQVGGEVARMTQTMEARMERSDDAAARALEKLGGEIARITERLAERIANAERRSAQAMDDVGEQVARVSDRLQDRQERTSTELSERIRLSEERTARLLEDARERIDQRLEETQKRLAETVAPAPPPGFGHNAYADPEIGPFGRGRFDAPTTAYVDPEVAPFREEDFAPLTGSGDFAAPPRFEPEAARFAEDRRIEPEADIFVDDPHAEPAAASFGELGRQRAGLEAEPPIDPEPRSFGGFRPDELLAPAPAHGAEDDDGFVAISGESAVARLETREAEVGSERLSWPEAAADPVTAPQAQAAEIQAAEIEAEPDPAPVTPLSTRELIEQARAAARAANPGPAETRSGKTRKPESRGGMFGGLGRKPELRKGRGGSTLTTALFVSGGAAALSVALVGYELVLQKPNGVLPNRVAEVMGLGGPKSPVDGEKPAAGEGGQPLAAVALAPAAAPASAPTPSAAQSEAGAEIYADGVRRIEAKDNSGVDVVRKAANLGYAPAQFYLAKLYEAGGAGVKKDADQARVWTERAAEGGDEKAMHNLALYYFEGTGGPKNTTEAAQWFRRAADLGLVDSQYNLARLYEEGFGVAQNPAEAYKWYLIAARSGDAESRTSAQRLKAQLSPEAQTAAERSAAGFQAQGPRLGATQLAQATVAPAAGGSADITIAQRGLSRLGYYQGPYDGVNSPALSLAIAAYQRDQGLPSTGALDATVVQRLSAAAQ